MNLLQMIVNETMRLLLGLYGIFLLYSVISVIYDVVEGLVNWVGNKIDTIRQVKTR